VNGLGYVVLGVWLPETQGEARREAQKEINRRLNGMLKGVMRMENEAATIPQYNKETPPVICQRCGFIVEDPNTDFEIAADNSRMHRLIKCFELVKAALEAKQAPIEENSQEQQTAAFNRGFRGSRPLGGSDLDDEAGLNDPKRKKK
jgi:hypothetical protein